MSVWISAVLLTKSYIKKIGKLKYFIILSIPVVYFSLQYSPILLSVTGSLSYLLMANGSLFPYLYNFVLNIAHVGAGVLFGISFFIISKSFSNASLKFYLVMCGAGLMIIFSSTCFNKFDCFTISSLVYCFHLIRFTCFFLDNLGTRLRLLPSSRRHRNSKISCKIKK